MDWRQWDPPPVGVRRLAGAGDAAEALLYQGVSYCDTVRLAGEGTALRVMAGSVQTCQWAPVVLGLKEPQDGFEVGLAPRLDYPVTGLLLAPLDGFAGEPEVVLVRAGRDRIETMLAALEGEGLWQGHGDQLDRSALPVLGEEGHRARQALVGGTNRALAGLARSARWQGLTQRLFGSRAITRAFEAVISRTMADMSMCRNSTVVPLLSGEVNVSFFCTGGITWGLNRAEQMTSGWPWKVWCEVVGEG